MASRWLFIEHKGLHNVITRILSLITAENNEEKMQQNLEQGFCKLWYPFLKEGVKILVGIDGSTFFWPEDIAFV